METKTKTNNNSIITFGGLFIAIITILFVLIIYNLSKPSNSVITQKTEGELSIVCNSDKILEIKFQDPSLVWLGSERVQLISYDNKEIQIKNGFPKNPIILQKLKYTSSNYYKNNIETNPDLINNRSVGNFYLSPKQFNIKEFEEIAECYSKNEESFLNKFRQSKNGTTPFKYNIVGKFAYIGVIAFADFDELSTPAPYACSEKYYNFDSYNANDEEKVMVDFEGGVAIERGQSKESLGFISYDSKNKYFSYKLSRGERVESLNKIVSLLETCVNSETKLKFFDEYQMDPNLKTLLKTNAN